LWDLIHSRALSQVAMATYYIASGDARQVAGNVQIERVEALYQASNNNSGEYN